MNENIITSEDKASKTKAIKGMLDELGMSDNELIDLIKAITEKSISEEKVHELSGQEVRHIALQEGESISGPSTISLDQIAAQLANGNVEFLSKYLSIEELKNIAMRVGFAFNLKRAIELGITLDTAVVSQMIGVAGANRLQLNGKYLANGTELQLNKTQAQGAEKSLAAMINNRQAARSAGLDQQTATQLSQITNDPNSFNNPLASVNIVQRVFSMVRNQLQSSGQNAGSSLNTGSSLSAQQQQAQQQAIQNMAQQTQRVYSNMRRHERRLRNLVPEVGRVRRKDGAVFASVRTKGGEREVKLTDYLRGENKLTPKVAKIINNFSAASDKLEKNLDQLAIALPDVASFQFDAAGRLNVQKKSDGDLKFVNIQDHLSDLKRDYERTRVKAKEKKNEAKKGNIDDEAQTARGKSRGPEAENEALREQRLIDLEMLKAKALAEIGPVHEGAEETKGKEKKEIKRTADELVKLDALSDKTKMLKALKEGGALDQIESSMKEVMKDMGEAEKNKDLLKDMQLAKKDRFLDK